MTDKTNSSAIANPWQQLRELTPARIALGRAGTSLPTQPLLEFQYAHAQARDAVHLPFDHAQLSAELAKQQLQTLLLHSAAKDRDTYLQRPDLGRKLDEDSAALLDQHRNEQSCGYDLAIVVADGLSALAVHHHARPMIERISDIATQESWSLAPIALVQQGRVAVADEVAERLGARMVVILIGERPGLSSPDSLGLYFTYAPKVGRTDADRNCISNIRLEGLSYNMASHRLLYLMREASKRQLSGVSLKDEADVPVLNEGKNGQSFLLG
ncbi:ethanolamine ammonia-lyase subunit EutC [Ectopseudomonas mendocina]|uniref:Ethanolamine ammonia-lyase small subunit n=1 Tax=Ectopseudomonas mendocina TaxID=300 RepID=A0ABZ2RHX6_ECTME